MNIKNFLKIQLIKKAKKRRAPLPKMRWSPLIAWASMPVTIFFLPLRRRRTIFFATFSAEGANLSISDEPSCDEKSSVAVIPGQTAATKSDLPYSSEMLSVNERSADLLAE